MIASLFRRGEKRDKQQSTTSSSFNLKLSKSERDRLIVEGYDNLVDCVNMYCLPGLGCIHSRLEWFSKAGHICQPPEGYKPCNTMCYVCNKKFEKYFLPVYHEGALEFLRSCRLSPMPFEITYDTCGEFVKSLSDDKDWLLRVFGKKSIKKMNCHAFFLQLIGCRILAFQITKSNNVAIAFGRDDDGRLTYERKEAWNGICFRRGKRDKK